MKIINYIKNLFKRKKLHKNKFNVGEVVIWDGLKFYVCEFENQEDTTMYLLIDENKENLYEWIDENQLLKY